MSSPVDRLWYGSSRPLWLLWPLAWLYRFVAARRRASALAAPPAPLSAPVIVVGNITAGGTGKSPLTAWLVSWLRTAGWRPVIVTRGYGGRSSRYPLLVTNDTDPVAAGDEPVMLAADTGCPVVVDPDRRNGAAWALEQGLGNILVCDDGLQHYRLPRDLEIAVVDGIRCLGNGAPIPVGPLREPATRLDSVDLVVINGDNDACEELPGDRQCRFTMTLEPTGLRDLGTGELLGLDSLQRRRVRAVAGIGHPARFFATLSGLGAEVRGLGLSDHHRFTAADLSAQPGETLVITAKDAVKCRNLAPRGTLVLEVRAQLSDSFVRALEDRIGSL